MQPFGLFGGSAPRRRVPRSEDASTWGVGPIDTGFVDREVMDMGQRSAAATSAANASAAPMTGKRPARPGLFGGAAPKRSFGESLGLVGATMSQMGGQPGAIAAARKGISDRQAAQAALAEKQAARERLDALVGEAGLSPRDRIAMQLNPDEYGKQLSSHSGFNTVTPGHSYSTPGGDMKIASEMFRDGQLSGTQTSGGVENLQQYRDPTFKEDTDAFTAAETKRNNDMTNARGWATIANERDKAAETGRGGLPQGYRWGADGRTAERIPGLPTDDAAMTPMQEVSDREWAQQLVPWMSGGAADAMKQLDQLNSVIEQIDPKKQGLGGSGQNMTGLSVALNPLRGLTARNTIEAQELVEDVVQRNLRAVLGAAFTEKEGERLIKRAYNPSQSEAQNFDRLMRLKTQMELAAQQKQDAINYYNANGTMAGFSGRVPTISDFDAAVADPEDSQPYPVPPLMPRTERDAQGERGNAALQRFNSGAQMPRVTTDEEFDALPPGTEFVDEDGKRWRK